jgi:hypothetical protein
VDEDGLELALDPQAARSMLPAAIVATAANLIGRRDRAGLGEG